MAGNETKSKKARRFSISRRETGEGGTVENVEPVATAVISEDELQRFQDLGLGRGINATDLAPWLNKSSFQVRNVMPHNIIGTDEGGACQSYESEIHSTFTLQTELEASIAIPQSPITIGVDAEQSRSVSTSRRSVGHKVTTRTINFRADFEDVPMRKPVERCIQEFVAEGDEAYGAEGESN